MKTKIAFQITVVIILSLMMFLLGRFSCSKDVLSYSVHGYPTSFNCAWPTYGLPLTDYRAVLIMLRDGRSKEAIPFVDGLLDMVVYDAKLRRPLLQNQNLKRLDSCLLKVALYREQFPRPIDRSTNGFGNVAQLQEYEKWTAEQKEIDVFLHSFVKVNSTNPP
jgi:hypothetical protein